MLQVTPLGMEFATLLILRLKRVTERTLPWGTPNSWSCGLERTVPIRTQKCRFERKLAMQMGKRPLIPLVHLFEVEEHGDGMLLSDEGVAKESFKPDQVVEG